MRPEDITSSLTKHYFIAVSILALLSTLTYFSLYMGIKTSETTAHIVNLSGQQRMLSQRIASFAQQYYLSTYDSKNISNTKDNELISTFQALIHQMRTNNDALSSGNINPSTHIELSSEIQEYYFGHTDLKQRVNTYLQLNEKLLQSTSKFQALTLLSQILSLSNTLLPDLMDAVMQYQKEGENNIAIIRNIATIAWILILFALLLEVIFIFQPMANHIKNLFEKVSSHQKDLEQQIEIRTLTLEQANLKLLYLASHDPLTGLKNRLNLENDLETLLRHYNINHIPYAVAILDIDWFKAINDNYGHDVGDFVLCEVAKILLKDIREDDNVYRSGGEEFVVIFNRITEEEATNRANKIRLTIQEHLFVFNSLEIRITISGGLYHPDIIPLDSVQEILKSADVALYEAKHLGRNQIRQFK